MMNGPASDISVVMSVYNNADTLPSALAGILSQQGVDLEVLAIDDGSTDGSGRILDEAAARDPRLKVVHKKNEGLTRALRDGCAMATAPWIARQDADDFSLPGRLAAQLERARQPDAPVLVACGFEYRTPAGEAMFRKTPDAVLNRKILEQGESPCPHGAAFFSRAAYEAAGGYRPEFYYAQDLDLFIRLAALGPVVSVPEVLYAYTFSPYSISTHSSAVQKQFRALIRRADAAALREAGELSRTLRGRRVRRKGPFDGYYFMGACLLPHNPRGAAAWFRKALAVRPWSLRAGVKWLMAEVRSR